MIRKRLLKYGSCALFVILFGAAYLNGQELEGATAQQWYHWICDILWVPGMILLAAGAMIWVSNAGGLDTIAYGFHWMVQWVLPAGRRGATNYREYVEQRREKKLEGYGFLLISAAVCIVASFVALALYSGA